MNKHQVKAFASAVASLLLFVGCNPSGTCLDQRDNLELGKSCMINFSRSMCGEISKSEFFPESGQDGARRCALLGYQRPEHERGRKLDADKVTSFYLKPE